MTTTQELIELRKLAEAATNGPWQWDGNVCDYDPEQEAPWLVAGDTYPPILGGQIRCSRPDDAAYIAAANPAKAIELIDAIQALQAEVDALKADAERYRWLRNPETDCALVLDKRTGWVPPDESVDGVGGYYAYEYRAGEELDAAIDAAKGNV